MKMSEGIDQFIVDYRSAGRINSDATERSYRSVLERHMQDVDNRDPRTVGRSDVMRTMKRWPNPNTQRVCRSILMSFYTWTVEEGIRPNNPAAATRRPKKQPTSVYRMTLSEVQAFLAAPENIIELRCSYLGVCAGLRNAELRGLQGRHFRRPGFVWVSSDIAKGGRERWIPVLRDLQVVWDDIHRNVDPDEYVLPAQRWRDPGTNKIRTSLLLRPMSAQGVWYMVARIAQRAGIDAHIHPHLMRHAFGDHMARTAGLMIAQSMLGHKDVTTTRSTYVGAVSLDELSSAVRGVSFDNILLPPDETPRIPLEAPTRIELVSSANRSPARDLGLVLVALREAFA